MNIRGGAATVSIRRLSEPADVRSELAADLEKGLHSDPKNIPSRYIYDEVGSQLFEQITTLPEYYLTRAETEILERFAPEILALTHPDELVELGSGSSTKTKLLLDAMRAHGGKRYVPIDISESVLQDATHSLSDNYDWLEVEALVGDYHTDLYNLRRRGSRMLVFLGSTIGNHTPKSRADLFAEFSSVLAPGDTLLMGVDLVKDIPKMVLAYNDPTGVTARFTRNVLYRINAEFGANFCPEQFEHQPRWNSELSRMEAWLICQQATTITIADLDIEVELAAGEEIHIEVSYKFHREDITTELETGGLEVTAWYTDPENQFGLLVAQPH